MLTDRKNLRQILAAASDLPVAERGAYLDRACGDDGELRARLQSLLAALEAADAEQFLAQATVDPAVAAQLLGATPQGAGSSGALTVDVGPGHPVQQPKPPHTLDSATPMLHTAGHQGQVGPYKLLRQIGEGGFGVVFLAEQTEPLRRQVALKLIKLGMGTHEVVARFEQERQALALMNHPNVAAVYDAGATPDGRPYFVMEYVPGEPITQYCDQHKLSIPQRLELFVQVCDAVQHAHQKAVIHRDLKPSNILVADELEIADCKLQIGDLARADKSAICNLQSAIPKVIDFGIAKATGLRLNDQTLFTQQGMLIGTPAYMSPEQAENTIDIDTRTDIYSLGVVLYELLTGLLPFDPRTLRGAPLGEIQRIIREVEPPKPSTRVRSLSEPLPPGSGPSEPLPPARSVAPRGRRERPQGGGPPEPLSPERVPSEPLPPGRGALQAAARAQGTQERDAIELPTSPTTSPHAGGSAAADVAGSDAARRPSSAAEIASQRQTDPKSLARTIRGDLDWIVMKCLEKDRTRRYDTASVLAMDIRRYLNHEPVLARPPSAAYRLRKFVRRNRAFVLAGSLLAGALLVAVAGTTTGMAWALRERARAEQSAKETQHIADFQASQLRGIDVQRMGVQMRHDLLAEARVAKERNRLDGGEVAARQEQLEKLLAGLNLTNVALKQLDTHIFERALRAVEEKFADQPLVQAQLLQTLADTLGNLGLVDRATPAQTQALAIRRRVLGDEHPDTLTSINNVAVLLKDQGNYGQAEPYFREALDARRRLLGDEHPATLTSISNMGSLCEAQGRLPEAESYWREALEKHRRLLGEEYPDTLNSINNLAFLLQEQGRLAEAEPYYREALEKRRRVLGDEHPDTLTSINNMGFLLQAQARLTEAEPYFREALEQQRRVLGDEHQDTLGSINNMGLLFQAQGRLSEAEPYLREALEERRRVQGDDHPDTLASINNMGFFLKAEGKLAEAEPYYREALEKMRRVRGDEHPDTLTAINNMGGLLYAQGKLAEAEPYHQEALEKRRHVLGDEHSLTLASIYNMGRLLQTEGKLIEAELYYREALVGCEKKLGVARWETASCDTGLGATLRGLSRHADAERHLIRAEPVLRNSQGVPTGRHKQCVEEIVRLYDGWHAAEPDQGYDAKAAEWRYKLEESQASTQPASEPADAPVSQPAPEASEGN